MLPREQIDFSNPHFPLFSGEVEDLFFPVLMMMIFWGKNVDIKHCTTELWFMVNGLCAQNNPAIDGTMHIIFYYLKTTSHVVDDCTSSDPESRLGPQAPENRH